MAKIDTDKQFKAREGDLLFYPYRNMMVVRTISGFTTEGLKVSPQYESCRQTANEFGRVSSLCKQVRAALYGILSKQNNLAVVNAFTKKMREVMEHDTGNARGERQLADALATEKGKQLLTGYEFNPDTKIVLGCTIAEGLVSVNTKGIPYPKGVDAVGLRLHKFAFDFVAGINQLVSGSWVMEGKTALRETIVMNVPEILNPSGVVFTILEVQFYTYVNRVYVPMAADGVKSVLVVEAEW